MLNFIERAYAQTVTPIPLNPIAPGGFTVRTAIGNIINFVLYLAGAAAIAYLIIGGITYITAGGDEKKALAGKTAVVNSIVGIAIVFAALIIIRLVQNAVNAGGNIQ